MANNSSILIVGAGLSGLTLAYELSARGRVVRVWEKSQSCGGLLGSRQGPDGLIENSANAFLGSEFIRGKLKEIGVEPLLPNSESKKRYIFRNGLKRWPLSLSETVSAALALIRSRFSFQPKPFESLHDFGQRFLGKAGGVYLLETGLQGIYAGHPQRLSASLIARSITSRRSRKDFRSQGLMSAAGGMQEVIDRLKEACLKNSVQFEFGKEFQLSDLSAATGLHFEIYFCGSLRELKEFCFEFKPNGIAAESENREIKADESFDSDDGRSKNLTNPRTNSFANKISNLNFAQKDLHPILELSSLDLISATVFFEGQQKKHPGFGALFPTLEKFNSLGVLMNSWIFPNRLKEKTNTSETYILGGAANPDSSKWLNMNDRQILNQILLDRKHMGFSEQKVLSYEIKRWPQSVPHYDLSLEKWLGDSTLSDEKALRIQGQNIRLHGNYLGGLGLAQLWIRSEMLANQELKKENQK